MRLLLIFDPDYWCSGTGRGLGHLPGICSARGVVAGHEQRGLEQHGSPRGQLKRRKWALKPPFLAALLFEIAVEMGGYCPGGSAVLDIARGGGVDQARFHSASFSLEIPMNSIDCYCLYAQSQIWMTSIESVRAKKNLRLKINTT